MHVQPTKSTGVPTTVSRLSQTCSTNSVQFSSSKSGDLASQTVIKGNIIYKRTETGEVIASVIKNGPKLAAASISAAASSIRGRPPSDPRVTASLCIPGETSLPADCPVNEDNVEHILDESVTATQSVRRTLVSLKDDLRRMGGGAMMSSTLKPIHLQHRINVAYKLAHAFADYRSTISAISSARSSSSTVISSRPLMCSHTTKLSDVSPLTTGIVNSVLVTSSLQDCTASTTSTTVVTSAAVSVSSAVETTLSQQKIGRSTAETVLKHTSADVTNVVSDDLWMSCEVGHD